MAMQTCPTCKGSGKAYTYPRYFDLTAQKRNAPHIAYGILFIGGGTLYMIDRRGCMDIYGQSLTEEYIQNHIKSGCMVELEAPPNIYPTTNGA